MRIGITYDLKDPSLDRPDLPDDLQEEFDSPVTIEAIAAVLRDRGHAIDLLGDGPDLLRRLLADPPDFVFNIAEGHGVGRSREARVPAVLEMLRIPHTGSDPLTLAATLDKAVAKQLAAGPDVPVVPGIVVQPEDDPALLAATVSYPVVVKPAWEGSSKGIRSRCLVERVDALAPVVESLRRDHRQPILVEEYLPGDELTVGVIGNATPQIIGVMRVVPVRATEHFLYSLEVKRDYLKQVRYEVPARIAARSLALAERAALVAYRRLGCRDICRVDFRCDAEGTPIFLEANPLPGLNPESSDLVILSKLAGWSYDQLVGGILDAAVARHAATTREIAMTR